MSNTTSSPWDTGSTGTPSRWSGSSCGGILDLPRSASFQPGGGKAGWRCTNLRQKAGWKPALHEGDCSLRRDPFPQRGLSSPDFENRHRLDGIAILPHGDDPGDSLEISCSSNLIADL